MKEDKKEKLLEYSLKDPKNWYLEYNKLKYEIGNGKFIYSDDKIYYTTNTLNGIKMRSKYSALVKNFKDYIYSWKDMTSGNHRNKNGISGDVRFEIVVTVLFTMLVLFIFGVFTFGLIYLVKSIPIGILLLISILPINPILFYYKNKKYKYQFAILDRMLNESEKEEYEKEINTEEVEFQKLLKLHFPNQVRAEKLKILETK